MSEAGYLYAAVAVFLILILTYIIYLHLKINNIEKTLRVLHEDEEE